MKELYVDNNATTKIADEVLNVMNKVMRELWGNPSSNHNRGKQAKNIVEESREKIAELLNVYPDEIIFTSGGTESNNLALKGLCFANPNKNHIISSSIEHSSVFNTLKFLRDFTNRDVTFIKPDSNGIVSVKEIEKNIQSTTLFISVMYANNEIGTIEPIKEIGNLSKKYNVFFHTDAVQALGKTFIKIKENNIDLLSASGHKINGPMGTGFLFKRRGVDIVPLLHGGGQENKIRSGTENVPGIAGLAKAVELKLKQLKEEHIHLSKMTDLFIEKILKEIPNVKLNGSKELRLANTVNLRFSPYEGLKIISYLNDENIFASPSSACSSKSNKPSRILKEIGLFSDEAYSSVRFSFDAYIKEDDIVFLVESIKKVLQRLK